MRLTRMVAISVWILSIFILFGTNENTEIRFDEFGYFFVIAFLGDVTLEQFKFEFSEDRGGRLASALLLKIEAVFVEAESADTEEWVELHDLNL
ncbi:hypothetical protein BpHYR1_017912 [Brachionus plicatilis]|uniref:Uncharacterized protein n=1 Tax=Brachionus plicatilis TaxID=10195 RepID=A0A3M7SWY2_BRAPC|nr:hypothetical protein BpHYR1_017912 [Brachionus plicatilis]